MPEMIKVLRVSDGIRYIMKADECEMRMLPVLVRRLHNTVKGING